MKFLPILTMRAAAVLLPIVSVQAAIVSQNTGSLGAAANGSHADSVTFMAGAVSAGGDQAASYDETAGTFTTVAHQAALNPAAANPFSVEFWAYPTETDGDDSPLSNRVATSGVNRSGWVFFQRDAATGWNFRMYNGAGSALGWDLTGGTAALNSWSHVVATWNGTAPLLYVNGALADSSNAAGLDGVYNASTTSTLFSATTDTSSLYKGGVDEVAFYGSALTPVQIAAHFAAAASPTAGTYHQLIRTDGALLQLSNNAIPEPASLAFLGIAGLAIFGKRRRA